MSHKNLDDLDETLAILSDAELMTRLREGDAAVAAGDVVSLEDLTARLVEPDEPT